MEMATAPLWKLTAAFESVVGYYWYLRLRGWEIDDVVFERKSFGNSYALPRPVTQLGELAPLIMKLTQKMAQRLRKHGYYAQGVYLSVLFRDGSHWHQGTKTKQVLLSTSEIYRQIFRLASHCPYRKPVHTIAVSCFNLQQSENLQLSLLAPTLKQEQLFKAVDKINSTWGDYVITPALMLGTESNVPDRVPFGGVKELEEMVVG